MTPVQALLKKMVDLGCDPVEAMALVTDAMSTRQTVDHAAENRRAWDREYRRKRRSCPPDIHPNQVDTTYIDKKDTVKPIVSKKVRKKELIYLPENWRPPDRAVDLAVTLQLDLAGMEDRFRDYLKSSGRLYADYDAAFCNFLRNERKFNPSKSTSAKPLTFRQAAILHNKQVMNDILKNPNHDPFLKAGEVPQTPLGSPTPKLVPPNGKSGNGGNITGNGGLDGGLFGKGFG